MTIAQRFAEQVQRTPDATAIVDGREHISYADLDRRAGAVAARLASAGVSRGQSVVLTIDRSAAAFAALLGISKMGAAYVPVDPSHPRQRLEAIVEDCEAAAIVTDGHSPSRWPPGIPQVISPASAPPPSPSSSSSSSFAPSAEPAGPNDLAYILFTSGSTGRPKGVMIEHCSVMNLADALFETIYERDPRPLRVALNAPMTFDASVQQIVQLFFGHAIWIVPEAARRDGKQLLAFLRAARIDVLDATPAHLRMLFGAGLQSPPNEWPKRILVGGEALDPRTWQRIRKSASPRVFNVYGPTECTVDATFCAVQSGPEAPSIGRALPGCRVMVLRPDGTECDEGELGEIGIGGRCVGRGYLKNPTLTAERFIQVNRGTSEDRVYRTGDLARRSADGTLEFIGRSDFQVKIRGYRIELGDIEAIVRRHPAVEDAVVIAHHDGRREKRLVAYAVARGGRAAVSNLRTFCREHLPEYMVPNVFMWLDRLPLGGHGKIDRASLPAPDSERPFLDGELVAPRDGVEAALAEIFGRVLRVQPIGVHDDFFDLGGDSILSLKVVELAGAEGIVFDLRTFLDHPTVAMLAKLARRDRPHGDRPGDAA